MTVEILRIHEYYVAKTTFTLMLWNGSLVLVAPNFQNRLLEMSKEELQVCLTYFYTSARKKDGTY